MQPQSEAECIESCWNDTGIISCSDVEEGLWDGSAVSCTDNEDQFGSENPWSGLAFHPRSEEDLWGLLAFSLAEKIWVVGSERKREPVWKIILKSNSQRYTTDSFLVFTHIHRCMHLTHMHNSQTAQSLKNLESDLHSNGRRKNMFNKRWTG